MKKRTIILIVEVVALLGIAFFLQFFSASTFLKQGDVAFSKGNLEKAFTLWEKSCLALHHTSSYDYNIAQTYVSFGEPGTLPAPLSAYSRLQMRELYYSYYVGEAAIEALLAFDPDAFKALKDPQTPPYNAINSDAIWKRLHKSYTWSEPSERLQALRKKAADAGDAECAFLYADKTIEKDFIEGVTYCGIAAKLGHPEAQKHFVNLYLAAGDAYVKGEKGCEVNPEKAKHFYQLAAEEGNAAGQCAYAQFLEGEARETWLRKAAEQGHVHSQYLLAQLLIGAEQEAWLQRAAQQNHQEAAILLKVIQYKRWREGN